MVPVKRSTLRPLLPPRPDRTTRNFFLLLWTCWCSRPPRFVSRWFCRRLFKLFVSLPDIFAHSQNFCYRPISAAVSIHLRTHLLLERQANILLAPSPCGALEVLRVLPSFVSSSKPQRFHLRESIYNTSSINDWYLICLP